jgi:hypothetical protein
VEQEESDVGLEVLTAVVLEFYLLGYNAVVKTTYPYIPEDIALQLCIQTQCYTTLKESTIRFA